MSLSTNFCQISKVSYHCPVNQNFFVLWTYLLVICNQNHGLTATAFSLLPMARVPAIFQSISNPLLIKQKKAALLEAVSFTGNGKEASQEVQSKVLSIVNDLERLAPPEIDLLSNPIKTKKLDGTWFLQYTSPSNVGDSDKFPNQWKPEFASSEDAKIPTAQFDAQGTVAAAGVTVDTSNRVVKQIFNVAQRKVTNEVTYDFGVVSVTGLFRPSDNIPKRAIVSFMELGIIFNNGFKLNLDFVFSVAAIVRQKEQSGWLETTYLDDDTRIGRGNKGTMFVITRDPNAVKP